jgi:perosamine synthetase
MDYKIPVYRPSLIGNEKKYVEDCLDSTWISSKGKYISLFEENFAQYIGAKYAVGVCNGTVALHLALVALGIGPGDEVIVPSFTYIASVNAIAYTGAKPVFVDSLRDTWQMNPEDVDSKINEKTKAIMVVHLYGHPCNMDKLTAIARKNKIYVIEDCAEAIGSRYSDKHVGTFGDISTFSFFGNKTITTGEGGMVVTNNDELHLKCTHYRGQGLAMDRQYWHDVIGYNYRMTNICAAIGLAQLENIELFVFEKQRVASKYKSLLKDSQIEYHDTTAQVFHSYWMFSILLENEEKRDIVREKLRNYGIETRPLFYPVHTMPMYIGLSEKLEVAEDISVRGINLPSYPALSNEEIENIVRLIVNK